VAQTCRGGKSRNGKRGTRKVWKAVCQITFMGQLWSLTDDSRVDSIRASYFAVCSSVVKYLKCSSVAFFSPAFTIPCNFLCADFSCRAFSVAPFTSLTLVNRFRRDLVINFCSIIKRSCYMLHPVGSVWKCLRSWQNFFQAWQFLGRQFYVVDLFFSFFLHEISELHRPIAVKLCHVIVSMFFLIS